MSEYHAPLKDMNFVIGELAGLDRVLQMPDFDSITDDVVKQILEESARFSREVLGPLNMPGDREGCRVENKTVVVPDAFADAYRQFVESGWQSLPASPDHGGMGLPETVSAATMEMWQSANLAFSLCPLLTSGAIAAIAAHASNELKQTYLPKMVSGEWTGTMNLSEPQAGSDLAAVKTRAVPDGDHYRLTGTKIFITWGDQEFSENVVHLVLARLPDAPEGVRGISLFLVPKYLVNIDGSIGDRNDAYSASISFLVLASRLRNPSPSSLRSRLSSADVLSRQNAASSSCPSESRLAAILRSNPSKTSPVIQFASSAHTTPRSTMSSTSSSGITPVVTSGCWITSIPARTESRSPSEVVECTSTGSPRA